jgi:dTDP-4-amino-4,6-dideoxygalactose transaminase
MAVGALGVGAGDEIIIPAYSYVAVANAVVNNGATPVFADVSPQTGNIEPASVAAFISPRTKAVIALHYGGSAFDIDAITKLCNENHLFLIEDAAQCIGSTYGNKPLGSFGDLACLSFDYMKNVTCGQGGLLIVNDPSLLSPVQTIFDNGTDKALMLNGSKNYFEWINKGNNYQINPMATHFLNGQLKSLKYITEDRLSKWNMYYDLLLPLQKSGEVTLPGISTGHNGHIFYLITQSKSERNDLRNYLRENGILSEHHYTSLAQSAYGKKFASKMELLNNAEQFCNQLLRLPLWYKIPEEYVKQVVSSVEAFYSK